MSNAFDEIISLSLADVRGKLQRRDVSAEEVTRACVAQIERTEPSIHALLATRLDAAVEEARALDTAGLPPAAPELAIIAKGDEVLDWREMVARYPQAQQIVQEGGEHALANFSDYLPRVTAFLRLA